MLFMKCNDEIIINAIKNKDIKSVASLLRYVGMYDRGGSNYIRIYEIVKEYNLDTSHWLGQAINKDKIFGYKYPLSDYTDGKRYIGTHPLKLRLFKEGIKEEKCEKCNNTEWLGEKIPLELHHLDGNRNNNSLINLQILCPNCHAKTSNFSRDAKKKPIEESILIETIISSYNFADVLRKLGRNGHGRSYNRLKKIKEKYNLEFLSEPQEKIEKRIKNKKIKEEKKTNPNWRSEPKFNRRKVVRPSREELEKMIWEFPILIIAKNFNLTGNAIHKWIEDYNITNKPPQCYWAKRNAGYSHEESLKPNVKIIIRPKKEFTKEQIFQIRELCSLGKLTLREIAKIYNVSHTVIVDIKNGNSYKKYLNASVTGMNTSIV